MNSYVVPNGLWEWLAPIEADERFALSCVVVIIGLAALVLIVAIVATAVARIHRVRAETALKRELLDRGLSPDEVVRVIAARSGRHANLVPKQQG